MEVSFPEGQQVTCRTYRMEKAGNSTYDHRPSPQYKDVILRGAKHIQLPPHYLDYLHSIEDNGYQGSVEVYDDVLEMLKRKE